MAAEVKNGKITVMEATLDEGWSWVVLFVMFWANAIHTMQVMSGAIFYAVLLTVYGQSRTITSWFGSLSLIVLYTSGSLGSYLLPRIGVRNVLFLSAFLTALAFVTISLSNSLVLTIVCYGLLAGTGYGLFLTGSIAAIAQHFRRYHYMATSISVVGGGVGSLLYGPILENLIEAYGWRGATLVFAGVSLNLAVVASAVFLDRPRKVAPQDSEAPFLEKTNGAPCEKRCLCTDKTDSCSSEHCVSRRWTDGTTILAEPDGRSMEFSECATDKRPPGSPTVEPEVKLLTVRERFTDTNFWCLVIIGFAAQMVITTYLSILKDLYISYGFPEYFQSGVIFAGVCNTLIRILLSFLSFSSVILTYGLCLVFGTVVLVLFSQATEYWMLIGLSSMMGLFLGGIFLMLPTSIGAVYGRKEMPITYGYVLFSVALSNVIGLPLVGYMRDSSGSYMSGLIFLAAVSLTGAVVAIILHFRVAHQRKRNLQC